MKFEAQALVKIKLTGDKLISARNALVAEMNAGRVPWDVGPTTYVPGKLYVSYWTAEDSEKVVEFLAKLTDEPPTR